MRRVLLIEMGMGTDLQGQDVTKAARRAVNDAIRRIYIPGLAAILHEGESGMFVHARLGVPGDPAALNQTAVMAEFPNGEVTVEVQPGGLQTPSGLPDRGPITVVVAAIEILTPIADMHAPITATCTSRRP